MCIRDSVQAAAAVALGGALAQSEVKPADDEKAKAESIERHNKMIYEYIEYLEETMVEGPALDKMKNIAMAGVKKAGDLTQKGLTQVGKGMDKAGKAVAGGISKTAAGIKKQGCLLYTSPSPRDATLSRMPSSA